MMPNDVIEEKNRRTYRHTRTRLLADPDKIVSSASEFREISFEQSHCLSLKRSRSLPRNFRKGKFPNTLTCTTKAWDVSLLPSVVAGDSGHPVYGSTGLQSSFQDVVWTTS
ncbi:hypothetical protein HN011_005578 [Eciton burchellii]|nr:hypothetical protein HN011_005578 [Eciton burchellii]